MLTKLKWLSWVLMGIILVVSLLVGIIDNTKPLSAEQRAASISRTIRCPQCDGETVAESNAPIAKEIRAEIKIQVSQGKTNNEIRAFMANSYGQDVLLVPPARGFGSAIWIIPVAGLFLALGILGVAFWRWRLALVLEEEASEQDIELIKAEQNLRKK